MIYQENNLVLHKIRWTFPPKFKPPSCCGSFDSPWWQMRCGLLPDLPTQPTHTCKASYISLPHPRCVSCQGSPSCFALQTHLNLSNKMSIWPGLEGSRVGEQNWRRISLCHAFYLYLYSYSISICICIWGSICPAIVFLSFNQVIRARSLGRNILGETEEWREAARCIFITWVGFPEVTGIANLKVAISSFREIGDRRCRQESILRSIDDQMARWEMMAKEPIISLCFLFSLSILRNIGKGV